VTRLDPPKTAHVEETQTSLERPPVPTDPDVSTYWSAHTGESQTTIERPGTISWITWDTSIQITLSMPQTEIKQTTLDGPKTTQRTASKVVTQEPGPTLDVPEGSPATANQPGTAVPIEKPGQKTDSPSPGGVVGKPDDESGQSSPGGNGGQPENGKPESNQGPQGTQVQNTVRPTAGGVEGLISAIQSVATKQAGAVQTSQNGQKDNTNVVTTAAPDSKPSVTGFVIGSQTASPGGPAFTRAGSTFSALPSGLGLQVVANGQTRVISNAAPLEVTLTRGSGPDSYVVGDNTLTAGGTALTKDGSVYSALPNGSGVQVIANGNTVSLLGTSLEHSASVQSGEVDGEYILEGQTLAVSGQSMTSGGATFSALPSGGGLLVISNGHTNTIPVSGSATPTSIQAGKTDNEYVMSGKTLTASGDALTSAGTTYSALPSGSGVVIAVGGTTSTASIGEAVNANTAGSNSGLSTPVLLPADPEQLVTVGDHTYTVHITDGSLLVLGSQTIRPGITTVVNGETLLLNGTNLVLATGTSTSSRGLGNPIMSGIGGGSENEKGSTATESSESSAAPAEPTSGAEQRSSSVVHVLLGCLASAMFALFLM
jgi:hypothetical protein